MLEFNDIQIIFGIISCGLWFLKSLLLQWKESSDKTWIVKCVCFPSISLLCINIEKRLKKILYPDGQDGLCGLNNNVKYLGNQVIQAVKIVQ